MENRDDLDTPLNISKKCLVCDNVNPHFSSICSECGVSLRSKTIKNTSQTKKKNKKKKKKNLLNIKARKCVGNKVTHPSKKRANKVREELFLKGRGSRIYYCNTCKGYHLTKLKS